MLEGVASTYGLAYQQIYAWMHKGNINKKDNNNNFINNLAFIQTHISTNSSICALQCAVK